VCQVDRETLWRQPGRCDPEQLLCIKSSTQQVLCCPTYPADVEPDENAHDDAAREHAHGHSIGHLPSPNAVDRMDPSGSFTPGPLRRGSELLARSTLADQRGNSDASSQAPQSAKPADRVNCSFMNDRSIHKANLTFARAYLQYIDRYLFPAGDGGSGLAPFPEVHLPLHGRSLTQNASMIVTAVANSMIWIATASSFQPLEPTRRCHAALILRARPLAPEA
jgi:hypothetical protein